MTRRIFHRVAGGEWTLSEIPEPSAGSPADITAAPFGYGAGDLVQLHDAGPLAEFTVLASSSQPNPDVSLTDGAVTFTAIEQDGQITFTVTSPPEYAGEYIFPAADLADGPVNLVPASASGGTAEGDTIAITPGLWVGDPALVVLREVVRGESTLIQSDFADYTLTAADTVSGLFLVETAADSVGTRVNRSTAVPTQFPNYLQLSDARLIQPGAIVDASKFTIAIRMKRTNMASTSVIRANSNTIVLINNSISNRVPRFGLRDSAGTDLHVWNADTGAPPMMPGHDEWASYILTVDLDGDLDGGAHVALWINGIEWRHTLASTGTGLLSLRDVTLGNAGNPTVEEFVLLENGRAVEPSVLAPLLFDETNGYAARNIRDNPPLGPWQFFLAGPAENWVAQANMGFGPDRLDNRVPPVTEVDP